MLGKIPSPTGSPSLLTAVKRGEVVFKSRDGAKGDWCEGGGSLLRLKWLKTYLPVASIVAVECPFIGETVQFLAK